MSVIGRQPPAAPSWFQETGPRGAQLLSDASALVGATHDEASLLRDLMALCLKDFCDWVVVYLADEAGAVRRACAAASEPGRERAARAVVEHAAGRPAEAPEVVREVALTGRGRLTHDLGAALAEDGVHRGHLRQLGEGAGVVVPMQARGRVLGVLAMASRDAAYGAAHVSLGEALGRQLGLAIDNARLIAREQKARMEAEAAAQRIARLQGVTAALSEALTLAEVGPVAVAHVAKAAGAFGVTMWLASDDGRTLERVASHGHPAPGPAVEPADAALPLQDALRTGHPYYVDDALAAAARFRDLGALNARLGHKALACLPFVLKGRAAGGLLLSYREPRAFAHEERAFLEALGRQCAQAVERARLFASEQKARSEAEAAAAALAVTETRFRTLIEQFPLSTQVFAADGTHVAANAAWERLTGLPRDALRGHNLLTEPAFQDAERRALLARTLAGEVVEMPVALSDPAQRGLPGEPRWLRSILFPVKDETGRPREVVMVTEDVTEKRQALEDLRASEGRYRLIAENTLDLISRLTPEGRALYVSPVCRRLLGYEPEELVGREVECDIHPEDRLPEGEPLASLLGPNDTYTRTYRRRRKDGAYVWFEMTGHGIRDPESGVLREIVTVSRDITERRRHEQEVEQGRRQVAQSEKLSALGSLVSGVAHEIRTPLAYISNHLFLIQQRLERAAKAKGEVDLQELLREVSAYGAEAMDGTDRINALVKDLSRFIRHAVGPRAPAPLHDVVAEAVRLFQATHRGEMTVEADMRPGPAVSLDRVQVQQVVLNLLENAYDAGPRGRVRITTRPTGKGAQLVIEDWGPGIAPEIQARMFDPFFTTKQEGTGLGLSIVRRIAETHGATLRCDSAPGKGTRFTLDFPAA